jgi:uncharacterized membrane protein
MRDFFINTFESLIAIIVVLSAISAVIAGFSTMFTGGGFFGGLAVLIFGAISTVVLGGGLYLAFGIYHNTKRTADAVERLVQK